MAQSNSLTKLWDSKTAREIGTWNHYTGVLSVALSPDNRFGLAGQRDGLLALRDLASGDVRWLSGHTGAVTSVSFASDSTRCLSAAEDGTIRLWDVQKGVELRQFAQSPGLRVVRFSPDYRLAAAAGDGPEIFIWELDTGAKRAGWRSGQGEIKDLAWTHDASHLLSASYDATLKYWDLNAGKECFAAAKTDPLFAVVFGRDEQQAFTGGFYGGVNCREMPAGRLARTLMAFPASVMSLAISDDRLSLLCGGYGHEVNLWEFSRVQAYASFEARLRGAQETLLREPENAKGLAVLGEWHAFRGSADWALDLLERARRGGADVSSLTLGRCYWLMNDFTSARREYQSALEKKEAPESYLRLCLSGLEHANTGPRP